MTTGKSKTGKSRQMATQRVSATPAAVDEILHLRNRVGTFALRHVAGSEGAPEVRLVHHRDLGGPEDVCLGTVGGVLFLIDRGHDAELGFPDFHIDVTPTGLHDDEIGVRAECHLISRAVMRD